MTDVCARALHAVDPRRGRQRDQLTTTSRINNTNNTENGRTKNILATLPHDVLDIVLSHLGARSLCTLSMLNRKWQFNLDSQLDRCWRELVARRWHLPMKHLLRTLGAVNFKVAYQTLDFRHRMPRGHLTEKHNRAFGRGSAPGIRVWILIHHGAESRLQRSVTSTGAGTPCITLRLCIQNVHHAALAVPLERQAYDVQLRSEAEPTVAAPLLGPPRVVAVNGIRAVAPTVAVAGGGDDGPPAAAALSLRALDHAVVSIDVACPADVLFETDFLCRVAHVTFNARATQPRSPHVPLSISPGGEVVTLPVVSRFVDEEDVWTSYIELPGGVILLRTENDGVAQRGGTY